MPRQSPRLRARREAAEAAQAAEAARRHEESRESAEARPSRPNRARLAQRHPRSSSPYPTQEPPTEPEAPTAPVYPWLQQPAAFELPFTPLQAAQGLAMFQQQAALGNLPTELEGFPRRNRQPADPRRTLVRQLSALVNQFHHHDPPDSEGAHEHLSMQHQHPWIQQIVGNQWIERLHLHGNPYIEQSDPLGIPVIQQPPVNGLRIRQPRLQQRRASGYPRMLQATANGLRWVPQLGLQQRRAPEHSLIQYAQEQRRIQQIAAQEQAGIQQAVAQEYLEIQQPVPGEHVTNTGTYIRMPDTPDEETRIVFTVDIQSVYM